jgi:hypothetical protein
MVGRASVVPPNTGVLIAWGGENYVTVPEYLVVPNGCVCQWVAASSAGSRIGLVSSPDQTYHFGVGLKNLTGGNVAVTRVQLSTLTQWYANQNNNDVADAASVLLVCETP